MPRRNRTIKHQPFVDKNTCQTKRRFSSESNAKEAAEIQEMQAGLDITTYKCERCGGWHLSRIKPATSR